VRHAHSQRPLTRREAVEEYERAERRLRAIIGYLRRMVDGCLTRNLLLLEIDELEAALDQLVAAANARRKAR
jgi:hypothetical protein